MVAVILVCTPSMPPVPSVFEAAKKKKKKKESGGLLRLLVSNTVLVRGPLFRGHREPSVLNLKVPTDQLKTPVRCARQRARSGGFFGPYLVEPPQLRVYSKGI